MSIKQVRLSEDNVAEIRKNLRDIFTDCKVLRQYADAIEQYATDIEELIQDD